MIYEFIRCVTVPLMKLYVMQFGTANGRVQGLQCIYWHYVYVTITSLCEFNDNRNWNWGWSDVLIYMLYLCIWQICIFDMLSRLSSSTQADTHAHPPRCTYMFIKVILCASEHICSIVRYCFRSFKQLWKDPLHVLTDANVLVLIDTDQSIFVNGRFSLPSDIHRPITHAKHR